MTGRKTSSIDLSICNIIVEVLWVNNFKLWESECSVVRPDMTFAVADWALKTNHLCIYPLAFNEKVYALTCDRCIARYIRRPEVPERGNRVNKQWEIIALDVTL